MPIVTEVNVAHLQTDMTRHGASNPNSTALAGWNDPFMGLLDNFFPSTGLGMLGSAGRLPQMKLVRAACLLTPCRVPENCCAGYPRVRQGLRTGRGCARGG